MILQEISDKIIYTHCLYSIDVKPGSERQHHAEEKEMCLKIDEILIKTAKISENLR